MISMIRSIFKLVVSVMWNFSGVVLVIVKEAITDSMFPLLMALQRYFGGREEQRLVYVTLLVAFFVETITFKKTF
jgi:hypothetical protein